MIKKKQSYVAPSAKAALVLLDGVLMYSGGLSGFYDSDDSLVDQTEDGGWDFDN